MELGGREGFASKLIFSARIGFKNKIEIYVVKVYKKSEQGLNLAKWFSPKK